MRYAPACWVIALGACWTGAASVDAPPAAGVRAARACVVHDVNIQPIRSLPLEIDGRRFARLHGAVQRLDVTITGLRARATVETATLSLTGDLALDEFPVRTRSLGLRGGWLGIRAAVVVASTAAALDVRVKLPIGLEPAHVRAVVPCADATFDRAPWSSDVTGAWVTFPPGARTPLATTPGGPAVVTVAPAAVDPDPEADLAGLEPARVIERRGQHLRVRLEQPNVVEGWVAAAAVSALDRSGEGFGFGRSGFGGHALRCPGPVPIHVYRGGVQRRVGHFKPGAELIISNALDQSVLLVELGAADLPAYVNAADTTACTR